MVPSLEHPYESGIAENAAQAQLEATSYGSRVFVFASLTEPSKEPAVYSTSGFKDMRSSILRSSAYRFMHERRHQFRTDFWQLLRTHDLIALSLDITEGEKKFLFDLKILVKHWHSGRTREKEVHIERYRHLSLMER